MLLKKLVLRNGKSLLSDHKLACIEQAKEEAAHILRNYFKNEEEAIFLDVFEEEYASTTKRTLNVEYLMMDANLLLPPSQLTSLMMNGVDLGRRLPCEDVERLRYAVRTFFLIRNLSLVLRGEDLEDSSKQWDLSHSTQPLVQVDQVLDLSSSDLIACTVMNKDFGRERDRTRRFMVVDSMQLILIEPDGKKLGFGVARFVCLLQDVEVTADKEDTRSLHVVVRDRALEATGSSLRTHCKKVSLAARFMFDDHIRCMAAKQRLTKGRMKARQRKMHGIARLIELGTYSNQTGKRLGSHLMNKDSMTRSHSQEGIYRRSHHQQQHHASQQSVTERIDRRRSSTSTQHKPLERTCDSISSISYQHRSRNPEGRSNRPTHHSNIPQETLEENDQEKKRINPSIVTVTCSSTSSDTLDRSIEEMIPMENLSPKSTRRGMMSLITGIGSSRKRSASSSSRIKSISRQTSESISDVVSENVKSRDEEHGEAV